MQKNLMNETQLCDVNGDRLTHKSRGSGRRGYMRPQPLSVVLKTDQPRCEIPGEERKRRRQLTNKQQQ